AAAHQSAAQHADSSDRHRGTPPVRGAGQGRRLTVRRAGQNMEPPLVRQAVRIRGVNADARRPWVAARRGGGGRGVARRSAYSASKREASLNPTRTVGPLKSSDIASPFDLRKVPPSTLNSLS